MQKVIAVLLCLSVPGLTGCATIFGKSADKITITSKDPDATILVNGNEIGKGQAIYSVQRGKTVILTASKKGCSDRSVVTEQSIAGIAFLNLLNLFAWLIDAATGDMHKTDPSEYTVTPACS